MRTLAGSSALRGKRQSMGRLVTLVASAGCVVGMTVSGGAVASASSASPATAAASAATAARASVAARATAARRAGNPAAAQAAGVPATSWPAYLNGPLHSSYAPLQTAITPLNAATLTLKWGPAEAVGAPYISSPIVVRGSVYVGGADGYFYRLSEHTGQVLARAYIGNQPSLSCPYALGVSATATYAQDPRTHVLTVYVAGGDGYLYALRALTLTREWRSVIGIPSKTINDYYDWSSPTLANGKIYIGVASSCDRPLVRGAVLSFRQTNGARLAAFYTVPAGAKYAGGSVWSSIAVAPNGDVFASTGNGPYGRPRLRQSESILKLDPNTLRLLGSFKVPAADESRDGDFGSSPVFFGNYVGACNKNGIFYALRQSTMGLAWKQRIGDTAGSSTGECIAAPVYDGKDLYFGGNATTIGTTPYAGSVQKRSAATGALIWETGLPGGVMGSPNMDGGGVIAVGARSPGATGVYLVGAASGAIIERLMPDGAFGQSVFAENRLFCATATGVYAWALPGG
jgi:outer membrane protein assembly factor BamB